MTMSKHFDSCATAQLDTDRKLPRTAASLRPGEAMTVGCVTGDPHAIAIRDAWQFSFPIRVVSQDDFDALVARTEGTVFHG